MPLPIAHGLLGASIVAIIHPDASFKNWKPLLLGFILGNCPDLDFLLVFLLGWQGFHRGITHSLFFALLVGCAIFIWLRRANRDAPLGYSLAFLSHTMLDFASTKGDAVRLLLPFDDESFGLGIISFSELSRGFVITDMLYFSALEILIFVPLFIFVLLIKRKI